MNGKIEALWLRPAARLPVQSVAQALAIAGQGLDGDHAGGGKRQITILSREAWDAACRTLGRALDPGTRRANVMVSGIDLATAIGATLQLGTVLIELLGETRPCELMDDGGRLGLQAALRPERRGGVFGRILQGGTLQVGDACTIVATAKQERPT